MERRTSRREEPGTQERTARKRGSLRERTVKVALGTLVGRGREERVREV